MPRKQKKFYYIYKTTNLINGKYYIGMHSTNDLNDGYVGSGKRLWYSIKKYGLENFKCEILEFSPDRSSLKKREKDIVNEDTLNDHMCMNLKLGGEGGFSNEEHKKKFHSSGGRTVRLFFHKLHNDKMKNDIEYRNKVIDKLKGNKSFSGKKHKEESKKKIGESNSIKQMGEKNSQFGTCWITNGKENKKIKKETTIPIGWFLGRKK
jgi:group I intron endonuclease